MINDFLAFIDHHNLFNRKHKILLAVSGGVDSVVMLHMFLQAKFNIGVAHCNFSLRGDDADADEAFVNNLTEQFSVPFLSVRFNTKKYATENAISTQEAARDLRYGWFKEVMLKEGYDYVATAHHLNDSLETVIYNLVKGTGINGLTGIAPKNDKIVRPLLFTSRSAIVKLAKENELLWREDASNASDDYSRNLIRNRVITELEKINPSVIDTFRNTQRRLESTSREIANAVKRFRKDFISQHKRDVLINKNALINAEFVISDELLKGYGFNIEQVKDVLSLLKNESSGKIFKSGSFQLNIDRDHVILSPKSSFKEDNGIVNEGQSSYTNQFFTIELQKVPFQEGLDFNNFSASLDCSKLKFPLLVRKWREGDVFQPLGMTGKKKLSDFMIDSKIPLNLKERVYVLESDGEIAWVIGHRLDERFKVNNNTTHVLNFHLTYHD